MATTVRPVQALSRSPGSEAVLDRQNITVVLKFLPLLDEPIDVPPEFAETR